MENFKKKISSVIVAIGNNKTKSIISIFLKEKNLNLQN